MLCNRPPDDHSRPGAEGNGQPPFKSTISATSRDIPGLPPARDGKKIETTAVKNRGPSAALRRHCQWIKELQEQVNDDQRQVEDGANAHADRKQKLQESFKRQRDAIRQLKKERDADSIEPHEIEAVIRPKGAAARSLATSKGNNKPLWAMTEVEKEGFEDEEAEDLIRFAEGLDFDKYISDAEFRECLHVVRDRAGKLQKEQDAFKDNLLREFNGADNEDDYEDGSYADMQSEDAPISQARRRPPSDGRGGGDDRPDWDASTCGDDRRSDGGRSAADRILEANPQLKAVHSKASAQRLIERASQRGSSAPSEAPSEA